MDYLSLIRQPIEGELNSFIELFHQSLNHDDDLLGKALSHIRQRGGKRMRPMLTLLMAKNFGIVNEVTQYASVGLELLHTASLVHDDVVDESDERRGQASVNASYNNKVAVLVGDYILSTSLLYVSYTHNSSIVKYLSELGRTLAAGEILQLSNIQNQDISEEVYFQVIKQKTAALFETCAAIGALSAGASEDIVQRADYYDSKEIGKPTGNDMAEGKLTLPVIYALNTQDDETMFALARKVKEGRVNRDEIAALVAFTKQHGGIDYAERKMEELAQNCLSFIEDDVKENALKQAFKAYLDYIIQRTV